MRAPKFHLKKKTAVLVAAGVLTVGTAGGAYAYWTTTGGGSGSAANASSNGQITLSATFDAGIYPGGSKTVTFYAANPGASDLRVGDVSLDSVSVDGGHANCVTNDFSMMKVGQDVTVPAGTPVASPVALPNTGTLEFANDPIHSQDDCKGATITLHLTSN